MSLSMKVVPLFTLLQSYSVLGFPDLTVEKRSAISIAVVSKTHCELVKIDPKSIR